MNVGEPEGWATASGPVESSTDVSKATTVKSSRRGNERLPAYAGVIEYTGYCGGCRGCIHRPVMMKMGSSVFQARVSLHGQKAICDKSHMVQADTNYCTRKHLHTSYLTFLYNALQNLNPALLEFAIIMPICSNR